MGKIVEKAETNRTTRKIISSIKCTSIWPSQFRLCCARSFQSTINNGLIISVLNCVTAKFKRRVLINPQCCLNERKLLMKIGTRLIFGCAFILMLHKFAFFLIFGWDTNWNLTSLLSMLKQVKWTDSRK